MIETIIQKMVSGGQVIRTWPLMDGNSSDNTAVEFVNGKGAVRKVVIGCHNSAAYEFRALKLAEALGLKTPRPICLDESTAPPVLAMEFIEGEMVFGPGDLDAYLRQLAQTLAGIHTAELSGVDSSFLREQTNGCGEVARLRLDWMAAGFDIGRVVAALENWSLVSANETRLLHGDFWLGNILWKDGELAAVVDWDHAGLGDPLVDLGKGRSELIWLFGPAAAERFTDFYRAEMVIDFTDLPFWDLCAVLRLLRFVQGDWDRLVKSAGELGRTDLTACGIRDVFGEFVLRRLSYLR